MGEDDSFSTALIGAPPRIWLPPTVGSFDECISAVWMMENVPVEAEQDSRRYVVVMRAKGGTDDPYLTTAIVKLSAFLHNTLL